MEDLENIKNELEEIKTARDNIKEALENEGETVDNDIRTFAEAIPNVSKVKTVNGIEADENKNVQIDASKINVDDEAEEKKTVKESLIALNDKVSSVPIYQWDGKSSDDNPDNIKLWQDIIDRAKNETVLIIASNYSYGANQYDSNSRKSILMLNPGSSFNDSEFRYIWHSLLYGCRNKF